MSTEHDLGEVAEIQGLYGPVNIAELLVQKLWYRQEFSRRDLRTLDGHSLTLRHPGSWNRLGGPDFRGAEWEIDGRRTVADIEIHFYQRDWFAHGHQLNPTFDGVGLHVLVFDPDPDERQAVTRSGAVPAVLVLAPHMEISLEEYAWRDALRVLDGTDPLDLAAPLLAVSAEERRQRLIAGVRRRWQHKVYFARERLAREGWEAACHQVVLEILGYRLNRAPMADLAVEYPLGSWNGANDSWIQARLAERRWKVGGARPASHPGVRLRQYRDLVAHHSQWPEQVGALLSSFHAEGSLEESTRTFRARNQLPSWRRELQQNQFAGTIASPRLDTIVVDGLFPLAAAEWGEDRFQAAWYHWFSGDLPDPLRIFLKVARVYGGGFPLCNGLQQGALDRLYTRDAAGNGE